MDRWRATPCGSRARSLNPPKSTAPLIPEEMSVVRRRLARVTRNQKSLLRHMQAAMFIVCRVFMAMASLPPSSLNR